MENELEQEIQFATKNKHYGAEVLHAIPAFFSNYVNFVGRSDRREYWWWTLWSSIITLFMTFLMYGHLINAIMLSSNVSSDDAGQVFGHGMMNMIFFTGIYEIWTLAILIPSLSLTVRRFRDAGIHWGWFIALTIIPVIAAMRIVSEIMALFSANTFSAGDLPFYSFIIVACLVIKLIITLLKSKSIKLQNGEQVDNHGHQLAIHSTKSEPKESTNDSDDSNADTENKN